MKVVFIQDIPFEYFGPMYLSAILKKEGHDCEMIVEQESKNFLRELKNAKPDIIAFSVMSGNTEWALNLARKTKKFFPKIPIIFGGPHPTFFPEIIKEPYIDIICRGEAEEALLELVNKIEKGKNITKTKNFWIKKDGRIDKNEIRYLQEDLDKLPFPDRELYYSKYPFLKKLPTKRFVASRGCPYNCTFCFNHQFNLMYKGKGIPLRQRSPKEIIKEIKHVKQKYGIKTVRFVDDTFTLNHKWLNELLDAYKKEIRLPFTCLIRANEVTEELIRKFKEANCTMVNFGIESGNAKLRNLVLRKNLTDEQIIKAARWLRKYKIKFGTYNMVGLPDESLEDVFDTIKINAKIKATNPVCTIFQPYPRTELARYAIEKGYMEENFDYHNVGTMFGTTQLKLPHSREIVNAQKLFYLGAKMPFTISIIKSLVKLPRNKVFDIMYLMSYAHRSISSFNVNIFTGLKLGYKLRRRFKEPSYNTKSLMEAGERTLVE